MIADMPPALPPIVEMNDAALSHVVETFPHAAGPVTVKISPDNKIWFGSDIGRTYNGLSFKSSRTVAYPPEVQATLLNAYARIGNGKKLNRNQVSAIRTMIHENLHIVNGQSYSDRGVRQADEAATDAIAFDLLPSMLKKMSRRYNYSFEIYMAGVNTGYRECTTSLRYVSAKATGGAWKKMPARAWRYQFFLADGKGKEGMLASQGVGLGELCSVFT